MSLFLALHFSCHQRSSVGWKGIHAAAILYDEYIVRVECGSSYSAEDKSN